MINFFSKICNFENINKMKKLKTLLGYYIPTFFEMQIDSTDDNMIISKMSDIDATILFHEYIHFCKTLQFTMDLTIYMFKVNTYIVW